MMPLLSLVALWLALQALPFGLLWVRLLQARFKPRGLYPLDRTAVAPLLEPIFRDAEHALKSLGFVYSHAFLEDRAEVHGSLSVTTLVYTHGATQTYAHVTPATSPERGRVFDVTFQTLYADGRVLATWNTLAHQELPVPSWYHLHDPYVGTLEQHWQAHQQRLAVATDPPVPCTIDTDLAVRQRYLAELYTHGGALGWLAPVRHSQQWSCRPWGAAQLAWQIWTGSKKRAVALKGLPSSEYAGHEAYAAANILAFDALLASSQGPAPGRRGKGILLSLSLVASAAALAVTLQSWTASLIWLGVISLHELGHWVGMRLCGYRDRQIIFLPFLGAGTLGEKDDASTGQKLFVYFLGPLPGLVLGMACMGLYGYTQQRLWVDIGMVALLLNYLNLLPVGPLDGGRIVDALFFSRGPVLSSLFMGGSTAALALAAWAWREPLLGLLAFASGSIAVRQWRLGKATRRLVPLVSLSADRSTRLHGIGHVLAQTPFAQHAYSTRALLAKQLWHYLVSPPPTRRVRCFGALVYALVLFGPLWPAASSGVLGQVAYEMTGWLTRRVVVPPQTLQWDAKVQQAVTPEARWEVLMAAGKWYGEAAEHATARMYFTQGLGLARRFDPDGTRLIDTLIALARSAASEAGAQRFYAQALQHLDQLSGAEPQRTADVLEGLAQLETDAVPLADQIRYLERALQLRQPHPSTPSSEALVTLQMLADAYAQAERLDDAVQVLQRLMTAHEALAPGGADAQYCDVLRRRLRGHHIDRHRGLQEDTWCVTPGPRGNLKG